MLFYFVLLTEMVVGLFIFNLFLFFIQLIIGKILGLCIIRINFLTIEIKKELVEQGGYIRGKGKFTLYPKIMMGDMNISRKTDKIDTILVMTTTIVMTVLVCLALIVNCDLHITDIYVTGIQDSFGYMLFFVFASMGITTSVVLIVNLFQKNNLNSFMKDKIAEAKNKKAIAGVYFPPLEALDCKKNDYAKLRYQTVRLEQAMLVGDMQAMADAAGYLDRYFMTHTYTAYSCDDMYGFLVFYYTYFCRNHPDARNKAVYYFNKVKKYLDNGYDSNDKRIYAYYKYYIENNPQEAYRLAREGLALLPKYPDMIMDLKEGERWWLTKLLSELETIKNPI